MPGVPPTSQLGDEEETEHRPGCSRDAASSQVYLRFTRTQSLLHLGGSSHRVAPTSASPHPRFTATDVFLTDGVRYFITAT